MNLNNEAIKAMDQEPCFFREERFVAELEVYEYTCSLTTTTIAGNRRYPKECDPITCPIWKTYIIQLIHTKK